MSAPNIWIEINQLPRSSQISLAAALLRSVRPTTDELAHACGVSPPAVRQWLDIRKKAFPQRAKTTVETERNEAKR